MIVMVFCPPPPSCLFRLPVLLVPRLLLFLVPKNMVKAPLLFVIMLLMQLWLPVLLLPFPPVLKLLAKVPLLHGLSLQLIRMLLWRGPPFPCCGSPRGIAGAWSSLGTLTR
jgi:hypothetical protein